MKLEIERPFGIRQERWLVTALLQVELDKKFGAPSPRGSVWATERQLGSLVSRGYFKLAAYRLAGGRQRSGSWRSGSWFITEKGLAAARVVRVKWQLAGWDLRRGPPKPVKGVKYDALIIDDSLPTGG